MKLKDHTVSVIGMHQAMLPMMVRLDELYRKELGYELTITSACDGRHNGSSRHYIGCAIDCRTRPDTGSQLIGDERDDFVEKVIDDVGSGFYVLDEKNHLHISLKPRGSKAWTG